MSLSNKVCFKHLDGSSYVQVSDATDSIDMLTLKKKHKRTIVKRGILRPVILQINPIQDALTHLWSELKSKH